METRHKGWKIVEDEVVAPGKTSKMVGEIFEDDEVMPERYEQAARSELWRELTRILTSC